MKKFLAVLAFSVLLFGCQKSDVSKEASGEQTSNTIKIGGITPLSGDAASLGTILQNVANMKIEQINKEGGINGKNIEIVWEDGKCNPNDSSRAAQKLIGVDKVSLIFGGQCSGETLGAAPITEKQKVILYTPTSSSPEITKAGDYVFRVVPSDSSQGKILADYANKNFKKVGMLVEQVDYSVAVAKVFQDNFKGTVMREDFLPTEADFKTRITKLKNSDIDALLLIPNIGPKLDVLDKQLVDLDWEKPIFMNEMGPAQPEMIRKYADFFAKRNLIAANFVAPENETLNKFKDEYKTKFGKDLEYLNYVATAIDSLDILKKILSEVKDPLNSTEIRDALYATKDFNGIFGKISFDENGDVNITHSLFKFDGKDFIPYSL